MAANDTKRTARKRGKKAPSSSSARSGSSRTAATSKSSSIKRPKTRKSPKPSAKSPNALIAQQLAVLIWELRGMSKNLSELTKQGSTYLSKVIPMLDISMEDYQRIRKYQFTSAPARVVTETEATSNHASQAYQSD